MRGARVVKQAAFRCDESQHIKIPGHDDDGSYRFCVGVSISEVAIGGLFLLRTTNPLPHSS
nr:MAG TPA: hypothetical protein [Caudoviricetes sp.]